MKDQESIPSSVNKQFSMCHLCFSTSYDGSSLFQVIYSSEQPSKIEMMSPPRERTNLFNVQGNKNNVSLQGTVWAGL